MSTEENVGGVARGEPIAYAARGEERDRPEEEGATARITGEACGEGATVAAAEGAKDKTSAAETAGNRGEGAEKKKPAAEAAENEVGGTGAARTAERERGQDKGQGRPRPRERPQMGLSEPQGRPKRMERP